MIGGDLSSEEDEVEIVVGVVVWVGHSVVVAGLAIGDRMCLVGTVLSVCVLARLDDAVARLDAAGARAARGNDIGCF